MTRRNFITSLLCSLSLLALALPAQSKVIPESPGPTEPTLDLSRSTEIAKFWYQYAWSEKNQKWVKISVAYTTAQKYKDNYILATLNEKVAKQALLRKVQTLA